MMTVLYLDILFLVNWMLDAVILILSGRFLKRRIRLGKISVAAALGGAWFCLYAILATGRIHGSLLCGLVQGLGWFLVPVSMVWLAYPTRQPGELLRACLYLYLSAVLFGGLIHVIYDNTSFGRFLRLWMLGSEAAAISIWLLAFAMAGSFVAVECGLRYRNASTNLEQIQDVTLCYRGRQRTVKALWDSGNQLRDPFTGKAVHILDAQIGRDFVGENASLRLIPCRSMGSAHSLLPVLSIDWIELVSGDRMEAPVIGLSSVPLSEEGIYQMLLHSQTDEMRRKPNNGH